MEKKSFKEIAGKVGYVLACIILSLLLVIAVAVLVQTLKMETRSPGRIRLHYYLVYGFISFFVLFIIPRVRNNTRWMMSFTHEFTHLLFALLFFRKIQRFKVDNKDSHVAFSGGWLGYIPIALAPYFVPIFVLFLIPWRYTTGSFATLHMIDVIIGFAYAFHVSCWAKQIRLHQTDITGPGIVRSLLVIAIFQILNFCVIILTPSSGVWLAINRTFVKFPTEFVTGLLQSL